MCKTLLLVLLIHFSCALAAQDVIIPQGTIIEKIDVHQIDQSKAGSVCGYSGVGEWVDITKEYPDFSQKMSDVAMYSNSMAMCHMPGYCIRLTKKDSVVEFYTICLHCHNCYKYDNGDTTDSYNFSTEGNRFMKAIYFDAFIAKNNLKEILLKD
jgi:hypothetical protein